LFDRKGHADLEWRTARVTRAFRVYFKKDELADDSPGLNILPSEPTKVYWRIKPALPTRCGFQRCCQPGPIYPPLCLCMVMDASQSLMTRNGMFECALIGESLTFRFGCNRGKFSCQDADQNLVSIVAAVLLSVVCSVTASEDFRRPAATRSSASARHRPAGYGFPRNLFCKCAGKDFSGPSVNAELRHLGAGPTRKA
jgi:hypothetical protein